jgi:hypothetical protein
MELKEMIKELEQIQTENNRLRVLKENHEKMAQRISHIIGALTEIRLTLDNIQTELSPRIVQPRTKRNTHYSQMVMEYVRRMESEGLEVTLDLIIQEHYDETDKEKAYYVLNLIRRHPEVDTRKDGNRVILFHRNKP